MLFLQLVHLLIMLLFRYYDCKRSAEKKEQKTIEAADKVRKQFFNFVCPYTNSGFIAF